MIHISEMSWSRKIAHPSKILQVGQQSKWSFSTSIRATAASPRSQTGDGESRGSGQEKYPVGSTIKGPVRNITDFGIFIGIEEGIDGLAHVSDLHWTKKIKHPSELFKKGDIVEARCLASTSKTSASPWGSNR
jgi:small subunit ribosomal protein S1